MRHEKNRTAVETFAPRLLAGTPHLVATFAQLVQIADHKDFTIDIMPGSAEINLARRTIYVRQDTSPIYGSIRKEFVIIATFAHEVGHLLDPPSEEDAALAVGTAQFLARRLARERTAWEWAEEFLRGRDIWPEISDAVPAISAIALERYIAEGSQAGSEPDPRT